MPLFLAISIFAIGVVVGILLGRKWLRMRQRRLARKVNAEYYKGLNYILNERPEQALQSFINLVEVQPQTIEIHVALGTLYRRRGQLDNAIHIHQNLLGRHDLSSSHQALAMFELAEDYRIAGVYDRAEQLFEQVLDAGFYVAASYEGLIKIYTTEREWQQAIAASIALAKISQQSQNVNIANFYAELAEQQLALNQHHEARQFLKQALKFQQDNARIHWLIADIARAQNLPYRAARAYCLLLQHEPRYGVDVVPKITALNAQLSQVQRGVISKKLLQLFQDEPTLLAGVLAPVLREREGIMTARAKLGYLLELAPNLQLYQAWLEQFPHSVPSGSAQQYCKAATSTQPSHQCENCGYLAYKLSWQCPSCHGWGTIFSVLL